MIREVERQESRRLRAIASVIGEASAEECRSSTVAEAIIAIAESNLTDMLVLPYETLRRHPQDELEGVGFPSLGPLARTGGHPMLGAGAAAVRRFAPAASHRLDDGERSTLWAVAGINQLRVLRPLMSGRAERQVLLYPRRWRGFSGAMAGAADGHIVPVAQDVFGGTSGLLRPFSTAWRDLGKLRRSVFVQRIVDVVDESAGEEKRAWIARRWCEIVSWTLPLAIAHAASIRAVVRSCAPKRIVLAHDGDWRGNLTSRVAASLNVQSFVVQHGVVARPDLYSTRAHTYLTFHDCWRESIHSHSGSTRYVAVGAVERMGSEEVAARCETGRSILLATNPGLGSITMRAHRLRALVAALRDARFDVTWRPHPSEGYMRQRLEAEFAVLGVVVSGDESADVAASRHACVVVEASGMSLLSLNVGRPVVVLRPDVAWTVVLPEVNGVLLHATSIAEAVDGARTLVEGRPDPVACRGAAKRFLVAAGPPVVRNVASWLA